MSRKLAHIEKIVSINEIPKYDRVALAEVLGWHVIVQKDAFKPGDLCVYIEIDSVVPKDNPDFAFLEKRDYRIRTIRMCGTISQGICFPLSILKDKCRIDVLKEGEDVTEALGIKQYEPTMDNDKEVAAATSKKKWPNWLMKYKWFRKLVLPKKEWKGFPDFVSKTDETRIQSAPFYLNMDKSWVMSEKIDGQSGTFALKRHKRFLLPDKFEYIVCSRNLRLYAKDNSSYWQVSDKYHIENVLRNMIGDRDWIAIQGECIAPNVQKNKYHVKEPDLFVFNLIYPTGRLGSEVAKSMLEQHGLKFVPLLGRVELKGKTVDEVLEMAHGNSELYNTLREGIVFRSLDGKLSFKAVDPYFLLKWSE